MGVIGKMLSFVRKPRNGANQSDVKLDTGGGDVLTATHAQGSGDDAFPLPGDYTISVQVDRSGGLVTVGFVEPDAAQLARPGERRMYARGSDRLEKVQIWLMADGTLLCSNDNGSYEMRPDGSHKITSPGGSYELRADGGHRSENAAGYCELQAGGTVEINTATIDPSGNIVATSVTAPSIVAAGKELAGHKHGGVTTGGGQTGANV